MDKPKYPKNLKINVDLNDDYLAYLNRIYVNEEKRLNVIEGKISQLISQSGLIISIIAVIVPLLYNNLLNLNWCFKLVLSILFVSTILLIGLSIYNASRVFNIRKFKYVDCSVQTVINGHKKVKKFKEEYIKDLIYSIENNRILNDQKGSILIWANLFFIFGVYGIILLALTLVFGLFVI